MRFDVIGCTLLCIAAFLHAMHYLTAALYIGPGSQSWSQRLFNLAYGYVGSGLSMWALLALIAGVLVLYLALLAQRAQAREEAYPLLRQDDDRSQS